MGPLYRSLALVLCVCVLSCSGVLELNLGVLLPIGNTKNSGIGDGLVYALNMSIEEVKKRNMLSVNYTINYTIADTACKEVTSLQEVYRMADKDAFIGPACSAECISAGLLAAALEKPMVSFACSSLGLSDRNLYYTFSRTQPFTQTYSEIFPEILGRFLKIHDWTSDISIISTEDVIWSPLAIGVKNYLLSQNISVPYLGLYSTPATGQQFKSVVQPIKRLSRVVIILAFSEEASKILWMANELGMRNGEYAFITLDFDTIEDRWEHDVWPNVSKNDHFATFDGIIDISVGKPRGDDYTEFVTRFRDVLISNNNKVTETTLTFGAYLVNAMLLYTYAVNKTLAEGGDYRNGTYLTSVISTGGKLFDGITGPVGITKNGNPVPYFVFSNRQNGTNVPTVVIDLLYEKGNPEQMKTYNTTIIWPGGGTKEPRAVPVCGFLGENCIKAPEELSDFYFLLLLVPLLLIIILIVAFCYYRKKLYERSLMDPSWLIKYDDIVYSSPGSKYSSRVKSRISMNSSGGFSNHVQQSNFANYKGEHVVVKKLRKTHQHLSREVLVDMKMVRDLHHANLNRYLGVCVESPNICMVSRFCNRGTLQDLLGNDSIKLDWMFRQSFANDIATGMEAIHNSPIQAHGNLKSSNCLIDSRWACKITDYGLDLLRANQTPKDIGEFAVYRNLFWTAPELLPLADGFKDRKNKTQAGDVYSYGIVLYEIITRDEPYSTNTDTLSSKDVIELVRKRQEPAFRPQFSKFMEEKSGHKMVQVTQDCWDNDAQKRPTFSAIKKKLKANGMGKNLNIVDNMITMMAKYTDQLEDIVEERTKQLAEEKAKTDELLYKMLPRPIADELKKGNPVSAESFQSVTIFFSDIVGFTSVAAQSTPLQVVDLLNQLYTRFDKVVDEHDVYKVETIGDAYMVVSGLPVRNGERHAGEVASMALNLLSEVRDFQIPHIPSRKVQLRIGIHSGSCVAGVVGLKMPRYCLFGDTVNYASRMESSGLALRIHVSPECKEVLDRLGGYHLDERGPVTMKGKGTIVTYFLTGKDGFDKPLPDVRYAAALADHEFK